jgi:hypothetical protein
MVTVIGDVIGRPLRYEEIPPQAAEHGVLQHGFPAPFVKALIARYATHLEQPQRPPTNEVEKILGRSARTYAEWVADYAFAFGTDEEKGDN